MMMMAVVLAGRLLVTRTDRDVPRRTGRPELSIPQAEASGREDRSMTMAESGPVIEDREAEKNAWLGRLEALARDVKGWAEAAGWRTRRITKTVNERQLGRYQVPVLLMEKDTVEVVLNPVARLVPGASGAVDLYLSPAYDDIASLYFEGDRWVVHYCEPPNPSATEGEVAITPRPYDEATIRAILDGMAAHA